LSNIFHTHPKRNPSNENHRQTKFKDVMCSIDLKYKKQDKENRERQDPYFFEEEKAFSLKTLVKQSSSPLEISNYQDRNGSSENLDLGSSGKLTFKNINTGELFEMSQSPLELTASNSLYDSTSLKGVHWNQFWKNIRKSNEKLWDAAESGEEGKVLEILDSKIQTYPAEIDSRALDNWTALHMAVNYGHIDVVKVLLRKNANVDAETSMMRTPLHLSCLRGHLDITKVLLDYGANINAQDNEKNTPLHYACEKGFTEIVSYLLLSVDPDITIKNNYNMTCLDEASSVEIRKMFEEYGLVNEKTMSSFGRTCFEDEVIFYNSRTDIIGKLLFMGAYHQKISQAKAIQAQKASEEEKRKKTIGPDDFIRHDIIGKGSFGEVYLVEKLWNNQLYAMKVLKKERVKNQNLTKYAKTERNIFAKIDHPFVVKLDSAFQTDTKLYLVLQYCPGGDLGNLLAKKKRLSEKDTRIYLAEIVLALEVLHQHNILYRDLKPDNVLLDEEGHVLLTDFGLSKEAAGNGLSQSFCGSIAYLPPEMLSRSGHNKTVDWYLLGVLMYEMLVGIPPYFSTQREQLFENIQKGALKLPRSLSMEAQHLIIMVF